MDNPVVYFEIGCRDRPATVEFYAQLLDWDITPGEGSSNVACADGAGINGHIAALGHEPHNYTMFYVRVDDLDVKLAECERLGGRTLVGPVPIPDGTFAWIADPEGNTVGLIQN